MFAERLKQMRITRGLTQEQLGEMVGVKALQIWRWESGEYKPQFDQLVELAVNLNSSVDYLLDLSDDPTPPAMISLSDRERQVIALMRDGKDMDAIRLLSTPA
jgi:transcriptional regulator with XRE-family HTH domain